MPVKKKSVFFIVGKELKWFSLSPLLCSDVFPYGLYMLAYEYAVDKLSNSDWVLEKRKQIKEMQNNHMKVSYIDTNLISVSIPIIAGAFAGTIMYNFINSMNSVL